MQIKCYKIFYCLIFCLVIFSCVGKGSVGGNTYSPPMQYSPVHPHYPQQNYQSRPYSGYYRNPYSYPPQNYYPYYYDSDQYYVPPRAYQGLEDNYYGDRPIRYQTNVTDGSGGKY